MHLLYTASFQLFLRLFSFLFYLFKYVHTVYSFCFLRSNPILCLFSRETMSTRKGESTRKRAQKYQNTKAFKNDLHDKTVKTKQINNLQISNVCERCKSILEWKIKYKKFKPLKAPATCTKCSQKCVKHAYHMMCKPCADANGVCPKCGKQEELVQPQPTAAELMKLDQEMQAMLKTLPERKRRTFLRYVEKNAGHRKKSNDDSKGNYLFPLKETLLCVGCFASV